MCHAGPIQVVELSSREVQALAVYGSKVAAWGWKLQERQATDASDSSSGVSIIILTALPLICGVQLNSTELKVGGGRPAVVQCVAQHALELKLQWWLQVWHQHTSRFNVLVLREDAPSARGPAYGVGHAARQCDVAVG